MDVFQMRNEGKQKEWFVFAYLTLVLMRVNGEGPEACGRSTQCWKTN